MSAIRTRRWLQAGVVAVGAVSLVAGMSSGAVAAKSVRKPAVANLANPGVVQDLATGRWVIHGTGSWASHPVSVSKSSNAAGDYNKKTAMRLLAEGTPPSWMGYKNSKGKIDRSIWAPSVIRAANGYYYAYYAVTVKGGGSARCIGTAVGTSAQGPFNATDHALACPKSSTNPTEKIKSEGKGFSLIDPTPVQLSSTELVLTYKTQIRKNGKWHTTTRLVNLDPNDPSRVAGNPKHTNGASIKISDSTNKYIEENPVLAKRGSKYTLFTSFGFYGTCNYYTRYHQTTHLWSSTYWLKAKHRNLKLPSGLNTCGSGNAQVVDRGSDRWLIFFNGHASRSSTPGGPKNLYVATLRWKSGKPSMGSVQ